MHRSVNTFRIYHGEGRRARHLVHELDACRIGHDEWEQMDRMRRKRLVRAGWKLGTGDQFLGLSHLESGLVTTKLALGDAVRSLRQRRGLSQEALAERMGIEPVARRQARGWGPGRFPRPLPSSALLPAPSSPGGPRKAHPAMVRGHGARRETSDSASRHRLEAQGTAPKWMIWPGCRVLRRSAGCRSTEFQAVTWSFAAAICRAHRPLRQINPWGPSGFRASSR